MEARSLDFLKRLMETISPSGFEDEVARVWMAEATKHNPREELKKINRVIEKRLSRAVDERLLVLDATIGQNAVSQAKLFNEAVPITGIVLTKLDGTAKGGIVLSIFSQLKIPIKLIGVGEKAEDLHEFKAQEFIEALF